MADAQQGKTAAANYPWWVQALVVAAVLRVFVFAAAYPFFNNVDELQHADTVVKFSHGALPRAGSVAFSPEMIRLFALYGSREYFSPDKPGHEAMPPVWRLPEPLREEQVAQIARTFSSAPDWMATSMPLYYTVAGAWYRLGSALGIAGGHLLYWTRFLNCIAYAAFMALAYRVCREVPPGSESLARGILVVLCFLPQDAFYAITSDGFSALAVTASVWMLLRADGNPSSPGWHLSAGLAVAAVVLVKVSNLPALLLTAVFVGRRLAQGRRSGDRRRALAMAGIFAGASLLPVLGWCGWNFYANGDFMGAQHMRALQWSVKPVAEWLHHPLFSPAGFWYFLSETIKTFWRGEFVWHLKRVQSAGMDAFFVGSSLLFIGACAVSAVRREGTENAAELRVVWVCFGLIAAYVAYSAALSLVFDFGSCSYPSRALPYFTSGRQMLGALLPFAYVYARGLTVLLRYGRVRMPAWGLLLVFGLVTTLGEAAMSVPAFASRHNWFHLFL